MDQGNSPLTATYNASVANNIVDLAEQVKGRPGYYGECNIPLWNWSEWFEPYINNILCMLN